MPLHGASHVDCVGARVMGNVKLLNPAIYNCLMECPIASLRFELFENIIHMKL
jgi:hypothetical protein